MIITIASKLPKDCKKLLIQHGYNPENGSMEDLIDYCERAETNENVVHGAKDSKVKRYDSSDESDERTSHCKKKKKEYPSKSTRPLECYCKYHGHNDTHNSSECKVLNNGNDHEKNSRPENKRNGDWKDPRKHEKKMRKELNLMQNKAKKYKKQLTKLNVESESDESVPMKPKSKKRLKKCTHPGSESSSESESSESDSDKNYSTPKQGPNQNESSSSSSDDDN